MARILIGLLLACLSITGLSVSRSHGGHCPPVPAPPGLPPMRPSPEGIWHTSAGAGLPVLFVHGWTMDHRDEAWDYEPILRRRDGWRRVYIDLPGMGRSAVTAVRNQDEMLEKLITFADREFGTARFTIAATSAGAPLAQALAERRRDRIAGLVLRMPMTVPDDGKRDRDVPEILVAGELADADASEDGLAVRQAAIVQTRCYVRSLLHKHKTRVEAAQAMANRSLLDPIRNDVSRYALSASQAPSGGMLAVPVLIITGRQDASVGYRDAWRQRDRYPRASYVALDRAEHGFPIDHHNRVLFEALVSDWLNRVEEAEDAGTPGR